MNEPLYSSTNQWEKDIYASGFGIGYTQPFPTVLLAEYDAAGEQLPLALSTQKGFLSHGGPPVIIPF